MIGSKAEVPIFDLFYVAVANSQVMAGPNFADRAIDGFGVGDISESKVVTYRTGVDVELQVRMLQDRLNFGSKDELVFIEIVVERLFPNAISRQQHRPRPLVPQGEGKHAS